MTRHDPALLLIGLRGSGKSTIARALGEQTRRLWLDLDHVTPAFLGGRSVAEVWEAHGEAAFREAEARALDEVLRTRDGAVIAAGGGTPTAPGVPELIRAAQVTGRIVVVYLRADASTLRSRLAQSDNRDRPPLTEGHTDPLDEVERVLAERDELYTRLADETLDMDESGSVESVAEQLAHVVRTRLGWSLPGPGHS